MIRWGLCCTFRDEPIKFRNTTVTAQSKRSRRDALEKLDELCWDNALALRKSLEYCATNGIGSFRVNSQILPLKTHRTLGYQIDDLPRSDEIIREFRACGEFLRRHRLRASFHPDQFVVLNSKRADIVESSLREIEYQAEVAEWIGADVINIHGGGAFGDKVSALRDLAMAIDRLTDRARTRLTVENDDTTYTPEELLPVCRSTGVPLVYDVHHHRCRPDELSIEDATAAAIETWNREPMFHISSPLEGWDGPQPARHHDFIDPRDFPDCWRGLEVTIEVEAKAKERAVLQLQRDLSHQSSGTRIA